MKPAPMLLLLVLLFAAAALVVQSQAAPDPLAPFRTPDGRLPIPGSTLTPELQRLLFRGNDLQPYYAFTFPLSARSSYPTAHVVPISFEAPNLSVLVHQKQQPKTWGEATGHLIRTWFPPVDLNEVGAGIRASIREGIGWFFDLFTVNAKAETVTVDSTTTVVVDPAAATCTTSQSAAAGDNAILVMLSNRPATAYSTVTYGSANLSLIAGTASR